MCFWVWLCPPEDSQTKFFHDSLNIFNCTSFGLWKRILHRLSYFLNSHIDFNWISCNINNYYCKIGSFASDFLLHYLFIKKKKSFKPVLGLKRTSITGSKFLWRVLCCILPLSPLECSRDQLKDRIHCIIKSRHQLLYYCAFHWWSANWFMVVDISHIPLYD